MKFQNALKWKDLPPDHQKFEMIWKSLDPFLHKGTIKKEKWIRQQ